jgi:hypothetical protein
VSRFASPALLVLVTGAFLLYGRFSWSWAAGPLAALVVWSLDRAAHEPGDPAPSHAAQREPAPVD